MNRRETIKLSVPRNYPAFLETDDGNFICSTEATTAQWRTAFRKMRVTELAEADRKSILRPMRQVLKIADALGVTEDAVLWNEIRARSAPNVRNLAQRGRPDRKEKSSGG